MFKRLFDFLASFVGLIFFIPLFLVIGIWIKLDSKGPIFFRQVRVGLNGKNFRIHKFRTMRIDSEVVSRLTIGNDSRITSSGHFLRKSKIDELPQLIDVLCGHMSLVGPRPEVPEFIDFYPENIKNEVLSVRPGITDLASIEMMDENLILCQYDDPKKAYVDIILPIKQKYYVAYSNNHSVFGDIKIIMLTLYKIVKRN
ncbi:sugar transferase [Shewanella scandinavica]|uniref:sugar transferase n=1 Tax=Shewanella scandinavica TaxID=3063538 RepID=UPI00319AB6EA